MLKIQQLMRSFNSFKEAEIVLTDMGINTIPHPTQPLRIYNYNQIEASKSCPIVQECRGLVLEEGTYNVIANCFRRFFNLGEMLEAHQNFDWSSFSTTEKVDGSFINVFKYNGEVYLTTRGSWGDGLVNGSEFTWRQLFEQSIKLDSIFDIVNNNCNLIFELCSIYNRVVRNYSKITTYLLSVFQEEEEIDINECDILASVLRLNRPEHHQFKSQEEILDFLLEKSTNDKTYEGLVLRDSNNLRIKAKSKSYVALHKLRGNGNIFLPKNLVPLCLDGEIDEAVCYFEDLIEPANKLKLELKEHLDNLIQVWEDVKNIESQKDFALAVLDRTKFAAILFSARKMKVDPVSIWYKSPELIVKVLYKD